MMDGYICAMNYDDLSNAGGGESGTPQRGNLVGATANRLRDMVFAAERGALIGSLQDLAATLQVGIVTIQQAARILEHEGLLAARRGPGGGYYGARPDAAALARSFGAYLRSNPSSFEEAIDITSLLFTELAAAAAGCTDDGLRADLERMATRLDACVTRHDRGAFETDFLDLLCRMVDWPLFKMLILVTLSVGTANDDPLSPGDAGALAQWRLGRARIISAILQRDGDLARFEADRGNRQQVQAWLRARTETGS